MFTPLFASGGTAFEDDPTNYFVSGSGANEALSMVNEIICFFKNTRSERYVNDGYYKATVYADECSTVSAASSSADGAKPKKSGASDGDKKGTTAEQKTGSTAILNVTRGDGEGDPVITKGWFALVMKEEMGKHHAEMTNKMLLTDVSTRAGNNFESLDRVTIGDTSVMAAGGTHYDDNDEDIYSIDRSATTGAIG